VALARLEALTYWYPGAAEPALRDVSIELDGGMILVAGPSGGGKSSLLRVFNGLVPHFHGGRISGTATVAGFDVVATPTRQLARGVGFVFQDPELQTVYGTVDREVAFGLENLAVPAPRIAARVDEALHAAGVGHLAGREVRSLSGGERQRVALASALAMRPRVIVLDEPTSQLDAEGAELVLTAAVSIARDDRAVIISEHRLDRLLGLAARLVVMRDGRLEAADPATWRPPSAGAPPPRLGPVGTEAWSLHGVTAGFGSRVVIDGAVVAGRAGEVVVLEGPNGGGKTTLLRLISGGLAPLAGRVERRPGRIAYLPQNPIALLHRPTVLSEVALTLDRCGEAEPPQTILASLGLLHVARRYPRDLSSGERQRAALAAVLPGAPRLVLLDEPTRGMDVAARNALVRVVARLRDGGAAVVLATHDAELAAAVADRVIHVEGGAAVERMHAGARA
jgi:energy-coupling factor transporter ATP-binding protein EcfA2